MAEILPGTEVHARGLRWEVVNAHPLGEQTLFRLRGLDQGLRGFEIDLLNPFEDVDVSVKQFSPENATPLNNWMVYHHAFLLEQHLGSNALQAVSPGRLVLEPYQLVPVMRALNLSRTRLLLCDDVGLGKTIQAGLVLVELIARRLAHRVLIVSPPGPLLEQWKAEMWDRFGLRVQVIDRAKMEEIRKQALEHLRHPDCESACYRCLKAYENQRHHDLLSWPRVVCDLESLSAVRPSSQPLELGDVLDPRPWLDAYSAGVGSPLELKFLKLFENHGLEVEKQVPVSASDGEAPISVADFAISDRRIAIYVDGAAFHCGSNLRRDRFIRDRLRSGNPPWNVVELRSSDLAGIGRVVEQIRGIR